MKSVIPNSLTALNLFCGCIAVLSFLCEENLLGIILVFVAAIADFFDGFVARLLKAQSELGKQLDSLADMVSFGFVPGTILYVALLKTTNYSDFSELIENNEYIPFIGFLVTVFSGFRLAKFNIDTRQSTSFIGVPTPANTLFFLTIPLIWLNMEPTDFIFKVISNPSVLIVTTLLFSYLLIAEIPLIALKFKGVGLKENVFRYVLIVSGIICTILLTYLAIPVILVFYILLSIIENISAKKE